MSERKLAEVVNDEVGASLKKYLNTKKGLSDLSHVPEGESTSSGSKTVLVKTVKQMQREADRCNKVRFLGFHRTVKEAAAECRARKFGERLRFLQGRRKILVEKERARRAELGLSRIKLPKRNIEIKSIEERKIEKRKTEYEIGEISRETHTKFIKICQPIQYSTRPDPTNTVIPKGSFSSAIRDSSFQAINERLRKKHGHFHTQRMGTKYPNGVVSLPTACDKKLSYSRFLCKELGATSVGLKKAIGNNSRYVPIHLYDKPPHTIPNFSSGSSNFTYKLSRRFSGWWNKKIK